MSDWPGPSERDEVYQRVLAGGRRLVMIRNLAIGGAIAVGAAWATRSRSRRPIGLTAVTAALALVAIRHV